MKALVFAVILLFSGLNSAGAQSRTIPTDTMIVTNHSGTFNGTKMDYQAIAGMQPVWDDSGKPIATLQYTYYKKADVKKGAKVDVSRRPLIISFNGGPGSASVWMHVAYTGPKILNIDSEGYPIQPYGVKENPSSILDVADIVYVNPVNTGFSRTIPLAGKEVDKSQFFGVNEDISYLSEWLTTWVSRHNRWTSPKYLIGESYGGTRVAGLAHALQSRQWMYLNGVIMVSPADYSIDASDPILSSSSNLPYYTAAAWYHKALPPALQNKDLLDILPEAESFAISVLAPALYKGGFLSDAEKDAVAEKYAYFSGLDKKVILQHNLDVPTGFFWKELLRDEEGKTIGRLDSRYKGLDKMEAGSRPDHNAELIAWLHAFTPAINYYLREELNFVTDTKYNMFGPVRPWNFDNNNVREQLREAMASNPFLHVMFQAGYYDGATNYFQSKYMMWQIDPSGKMKDRFSFKGYRSGHMMYLREEDLKSANQHIREFLKQSSPGDKPAKY